uniref:Uncharacterized protein n=1 Tax=Palpitomonas bilix TaxID=652834 RepID=A0A7S3G886_9EUKA|mmetsp:Transcript_38144/g.98496  ORF Transcript_38144/g.98496 Transcript_38144/m.98496 type:complete len:175 (+) Transcript_38144:245-769(+)
MAESEAGKTTMSGVSAVSGAKSEIAGISKEHVQELAGNASVINKLTDEFDGFYESLEKDIDAKKAAEKAKFEALKARVTNVENNVKSESKRMTDSLAALQTLFETSLAKVQTKLEKQIEQATMKLDAKIYKLSEKHSKLEAEVAKNSKEYKKEFEILQESLTQKIDENTKVINI